MNENIEKVKSQYDEEVKRLQKLAAATQQKYQNEFNRLKEVEQNLLNEYNAEIQKITIGIERLRGAYTALCDFEEGKAPTLVENGMMKDVEIPEVVEGPVEEKANEPEPTREEPATEEPTNEISEEVKAKAKEVVKKAKEAGKVTPYEEFAKSDLGKETAVKDVKEMIADESKIENAQLHQSGEVILSEEEVEALKAVTEQITTEDNTPNETANAEKVKPEDVPDYLKDQYNLK